MEKELKLAGDKTSELYKSKQEIEKEVEALKLKLKEQSADLERQLLKSQDYVDKEDMLALEDIIRHQSNTIEEQKGKSRQHGETTLWLWKSCG